MTTAECFTLKLPRYTVYPKSINRVLLYHFTIPHYLHYKQLVNLLKPLTMSKLRLKNSEGFLARFKGDLDDQYPYYFSMDVKSLYTTYDMRKAVEIMMERLNDNPNILTPPIWISPEGIRSLLNFSLEYNNRYFRQNSGGPMGSPLTVALAEIRVSYLEEEALRTCPESPIHYYHFVDDCCGHFRNKIQPDKFLEHRNSLTLSPDLDYKIEYPHPDGSITIPFLDVLIHPDCSTSVYRKPTNTNLYTHYSSSSYVL